MLTGLHEGSFANVQLGAGLFLHGFDGSGAEDAETLLDLIADAIEQGQGVIGATKGGGCFRCVPRLRQLGADGMRGPTRGAMVNDGWTVRMTGTLMELTPENFRLALPGAKVTRDGRRTVVEVRGEVSESDYVDRLCWIGNTVKGLLMIELDNALNLAGAVFTFSDQTEGVMPFEFQAHSDSLGNMEAPCRLVWLEEAAK